MASAGSGRPATPPPDGPPYPRRIDGSLGRPRAEVLTDLRHEHARLLGLLVMLRELGRGDLVEAEALRTVDLSEVADAAVAEARRRTPDALITVDAAPGLTVHGWEPGLRLLLDNLLANALAHGRDADGRATPSGYPEMQQKVAAAESAVAQADKDAAQDDTGR